MVCKNHCKKHEYIREGMSYDVYVQGIKRCLTCGGKWIRWPWIYCPCCGMQLRTNPRNKHGITIKTLIDSKRIK